MAYGTLAINDLLQTTDQSVIDYGEDRVWQAVSDYFAAHNSIVQEQLARFVDMTTDRLRRYGSAPTMQMEAVDEFGRVDAQKITGGENVGFPLRRYAVALQWTRLYLLQATPAELAAQVRAAATADVLNVQTQLKKAIYTPTNTTFIDRLVDNVSLPVKALINADSTSMPIGPNGETFDGATHTHYLARAGGSLAASDVSALIDTVREHYTVGTPMLIINQAQEAAIRAMTSNFTPYMDARIVVGANTTVANGNLDQSNMYNRAIGIFDSAEVWVKPWALANYLFAYVQGAPKPVVMRERRAGSGMLVLDYENDQFPLRARQMAREFGMGVFERTNGAVLYAGGTTYSVPAL